jgi:hypothetical protein
MRNKESCRVGSSPSLPTSKCFPYDPNIKFSFHVFWNPIVFYFSFNINFYSYAFLELWGIAPIFIDQDQEEHLPRQF